MTKFLHGFGFGQPWWLLLLALVPVLAWLLGEPGRPASLRYSSASLLREAGARGRGGPRRFFWWLRLVSIALLIIGLARPRLDRSDDEQQRFGVDIALVCDVSGSMDEKDVQQGTGQIRRMDALIAAIRSFVEARAKDRTGLVGFAGEVYLLSPLTTDATWLPNVLEQIKLQKGTAIGEGIFSGLDLLEKSDAKSRVLIVVSDGFSNRGRDPVVAAAEAKKRGVRIHALQITSLQEAMRLQRAEKTGTGTENALALAARESGGLFFSATSAAAMRQIYLQIDQLEKHRFEVKHSRLYDEKFPWPVIAGLLLALGELTGGATRWVRLP